MRTARAERRSQRLVALFAAGWLIFDFPLMSLWVRDTTVAGLPFLPVALFAIWAVLIGLLAWTLERESS